MKKPPARPLSIKAAAKATGLSVDTLRYYERAGLIFPPQRSSSGRRTYARSDIEWIRFIVRLRAAGLPLARIREYATLVRDGASTIAERCTLLNAHAHSIEQQVLTLSATLQEVRRVIRAYRRAVKSNSPDFCESLTRSKP